MERDGKNSKRETHQKGWKVEMDGLQGTVVDTSFVEILVEWDTGFKTWVDKRKVKIIGSKNDEIRR